MSATFTDCRPAAPLLSLSSRKSAKGETTSPVTRGIWLCSLLRSNFWTSSSFFLCVCVCGLGAKDEECWYSDWTQEEGELCNVCVNPQVLIASQQTQECTDVHSLCVCGVGRLEGAGTEWALPRQPRSLYVGARMTFYTLLGSKPRV